MSPEASSDPLISERISGVPSPPNSFVSKTRPIAIPATEHLIGTPASRSARQPPQTDAMLNSSEKLLALSRVPSQKNSSKKEGGLWVCNPLYLFEIKKIIITSRNYWRDMSPGWPITFSNGTFNTNSVWKILFWGQNRFQCPFCKHAMTYLPPARCSHPPHFPHTGWWKWILQLKKNCSLMLMGKKEN